MHSQEITKTPEAGTDCASVGICRLNQTRVCHVCSNHRSKEEKISTTCKSTLLATITIVVLSWSLLCCNQCAIDKSLADSMNSSCSCIKCVRYLFYQSELILQVFFAHASAPFLSKFNEFLIYSHQTGHRLTTPLACTSVQLKCFAIALFSILEKSFVLFTFFVSWLYAEIYCANGLFLNCWCQSNFGIFIFQINFLVCQILALFFASFFRSYLHTSKVTATIRHAFGLTMGLIFGYFCFGQQAIHIAGLPAVCYIIIRTQNPQIVQR